MPPRTVKLERTCHKHFVVGEDFNMARINRGKITAYLLFNDRSGFFFARFVMGVQLKSCISGSGGRGEVVVVSK